MKELWIVIPDYKYLIKLWECDSEADTIEYNLYKYEDQVNMREIMDDSDEYEPYDGGYYTVDEYTDINAILTPPYSGEDIDDFVDYICDTEDDDTPTPDYGFVEMPTDEEE